MAYEIFYSGGSIRIPDGSLNTQTTLKLPGREYLGYGVHIVQDLVTLAGSFATSGSSGPENAIQGQVWFDRHIPIGATAPNNLFKYNISTSKGNPEWIVLAASGVNANVSFGNLDVFFDFMVGGDANIWGDLYVDDYANIGLDVNVGGDVAVNGGDITSTATTFNLLTSNATTVNFAHSATNLSMGAVLSGNTTIRNDTTLDRDLYILGNDIVTNQTEFNLLNTNVTKLNFAGDGTDITIGSAAVLGNTLINTHLILNRDLEVRGGNIYSPSEAFGLLNQDSYLSGGDDGPTIVDAFLNASTINMGDPTGTMTIRNADVVMDGDLQIKGGDLTTNQTAFNLLNTTATTINFGGVATTVEIGAATGTTNVNNNLRVDLNAFVGGNLTVQGNLTYINVEEMRVEDPLLELGGGPNGSPLTSNDGKDRGLLMHYYRDGAAVNAFMGWDNSANAFAIGTSVTYVGEVITYGAYGNLYLENLYGNNATLTNYLYAQNANVTNNVQAFQVNAAFGNIHTIVASTVHANNNGSGTNFRVGDDAWIGDINISDTIGIRGIQSGGSAGYIVFGNGDSSKLGRTGTGPLTYSGSFNPGSLLTTNITTGGITIPGTITGYWSLVGASRLEATYADLAERFESDFPYEPGTVVELGGAKEITAIKEELSDNVFGVISKNAAYMMNSSVGNDETHPAVALAGRVPVKVIGKVKKGDRLVSAGNGIARSASKQEITAFNVIGRSLEYKDHLEEGTVIAAVKMKI